MPLKSFGTDMARFSGSQTEHSGSAISNTLKRLVRPTGFEPVTY